MQLFVLICAVFSFNAKTLSQPALPEIPKNAEWKSGPAVYPLAGLAEIKVPEGFRFTDADGAKSLLQRMNNPVPKGLIGIVAPNSGGWWVILQYSEVGYVADASAERLDPQSILTEMQNKIESQNAERAKVGLQSVEQVVWAIEPTYDPANKTLEWAVKAQAGQTAVINHTVRLFSRKGMLDAIAVRPFSENADLSTVKQLMAGVKFAQGQQYADYKKGDKVASKSIAELIVSEEADETKSALAGTGMKSIWVGIAAVLLIVCFVAAGATVAVKKLRTKAPVLEKSTSAVAATAAVEPINPQAPAQPAQPAPRQVLLHSKPKAADFKARPVVNGANGARKRGFDYNRYFTDLMSNVYSGSYGVDVPAPNGYSQEEVNGQSYGPGLSMTNGKAVNGSTFIDPEMLAAQRTLIEEQRRLIQEQSKLIEEKSRLIEEKNKILRLQADLMDHKLV